MDEIATELENTAIPNMEALARGTHLCQFYETRQDLLDIVVPYFRVGLDSNELCVWVTSKPLLSADALQAMMSAVPLFDQHVRKGQMEIVPYVEWYIRDGKFSPEKAMEAVHRRLTVAADEGYSGLRLSSNLAWLKKTQWQDFTRYEEAMDSLTGGFTATTLCSYPLAICGVRECLNVMSNHRLALMKDQGEWHTVENSGQARAAAALRHTDEEYRHLFESTRDGMEVIDGSTGRILLANRAAASVFGFDSPEDMVGTDPLDRIPATDRDRVAAIIAEYASGRDMRQPVELRALRTDGTTVWLSAIGVRTEYRGRPASLVSLRDVTGLRQAEQALRDAEHRYRLLAENVSDVIWVTDMDLNPVFVSPSIRRMLGYSVEEAMAGRLESRLSVDSSREATAAFERALARERVRPGCLSATGTLELQFRHKDGSLVWAETAVSFLRDSRGRPVEILGVLHDVSRRKKAEDHLQSSLATLERTVESAIHAIASTVETKDVYTAGHQRRVTQLACAMAREMGLPADTVRIIRIAGLLHDLGKISLPTDILTKPGQLTRLEFAVIRTHPQVAYDVLKNIESFDRIALVVLQHHERMNGSGYPSGLHGEESLLEARILAVADVIEAMYAYRPYRPALGLERALEEVTRNRGTLYDPAAVDACLRVFHQGFQFTD